MTGTRTRWAGDGHLAHEAGHGTFIAGIIMRLAPELRIRQVKVLDPAGVSDDATMAAGLAMASAPVINLSLGGYTPAGRPPVASGRPRPAQRLGGGGRGGREQRLAGAVLAGRFQPRGGRRRAGHDGRRAGQRRAFSNYGHWVDVYAPGMHVHSMYLDGSYLEADKHLAHLKGWAQWSGTSFAAPHVAAEIARRARDGVSAHKAAHQVLGGARWLPGIGAVVHPRVTPGVRRGNPPWPRQTRARRGHPRERVVGGGICCRRCQRPPGDRPARRCSCQPRASRAATLSGSGSSGGDHRSGAHCQQRCGQPHHLVAGLRGARRISQAASMMVCGALAQAL